MSSHMFCCHVDQKIISTCAPDSWLVSRQLYRQLLRNGHLKFIRILGWKSIRDTSNHLLLCDHRSGDSVPSFVGYLLSGAAQNCTAYPASHKKTEPHVCIFLPSTKKFSAMTYINFRPVKIKFSCCSFVFPLK